MKRKIMGVSVLIAGLALVALICGASELPYRSEPFEQLTVGGQPSVEDLLSLSQQGYTTVINLRPKGEFDDLDEEAEVEALGMEYIHIPVKNVKSIDQSDADALHTAITTAPGPVLLHCTIGWRAAGLLAIERYLLHGASPDEAVEIATAAHMSHAGDDVAVWIEENQ
jgi:uncharacterized protein (TIGR01244 family)